MVDKQTEYKCEKCGADLNDATTPTRDRLCKTCALKLMYGVSNNKRRFRKKK